MKTINTLFIVLCSISLLLCIYSNEKGYLFPFVKGQVNLNENSNLKQAILPEVVQSNNGSAFHLSAGKLLKNINGNNVWLQWSSSRTNYKSKTRQYHIC